MIIAARILRLLAFTIWIGGIVFFGAVVARNAFQIFGPTEPFADFIGRSLLQLHSIGTWCGIAILVALRMLGKRAYQLNVQAGLALLMMVLTFVSNRAIILPMERDRVAAGGNINILLPGSPLREDFDARHAWSTRVESVILLAGLGLAVLIGMEGREPVTADPARKIFDLSSEA